MTAVLLILKELWSSPIVRWGTLVLVAVLALHFYVEHKVSEERAIAQATLDHYAGEVLANEKIVNGQIDTYRGEADKAKADLKDALEGIANRKATVITVIKEVPKYVTVKADARSVASNAFPAGWVYLYNLPLRTEVPTLAGSPPGDVDAPTGLRASTVVGVAASNNAECVARGETLTKWVQWYTAAKTRYEDFFRNLPPPVPIPDNPDESKRKRGILGLGIPNPFS